MKWPSPMARKRVLALVFVLLATMASLSLPLPATRAQGSDEPAPPPVFDPAQYQPMPLPEWRPSLRLAGAPDRLVSYDLASGQETVLTAPSNIPMPSTELVMPAGEPAGSPDPLNSTSPDAITPTSFSALQRVVTPSAYPTSASVRLFADFGQQRFSCSGALIVPRYVLTAGHCIHMLSRGWATSVVVIPAYENGYEPFGHARVTNLYSWAAWTQSEDFNWDMGYLRLDRPVGAIAGWLGYGVELNEQITSSPTMR